MKPELAREIDALVGQVSHLMTPNDWHHWSERKDALVDKYAERITELQEMIEAQAELIDELQKDKLVFRRKAEDAEGKIEWFITLPKFVRWLIEKTRKENGKKKEA